MECIVAVGQAVILIGLPEVSDLTEEIDEEHSASFCYVLLTYAQIGLV